jgi:hypothetical protein
MGDDAQGMAYYLWPLQWIGSEPPGVQPPSEVRAADLAEMVFEANLVEGIRLRAYRDGMLTFDFADWVRSQLSAYPIRTRRLSTRFAACG